MVKLVRFFFFFLVQPLMFPFHSFYSEIKLDEAAVLHYTYPKFSDLTSRRDRCGCKPTKEDVKRCFMLEFDRAVSSDSFTLLVFYPFTPHGWQKKKKNHLLNCKSASCLCSSYLNYFPFWHFIYCQSSYSWFTYHVYKFLLMISVVIFKSYYITFHA